MKLAIVLTVIINSAFCQIAYAQEKNGADRLTVELRVSNHRVHLTDEVIVSVFFRSPNRSVTIWNALGWNASTGLSLRVLDGAGRQVNEFLQMYDILPPAESGKNALISIGGDTFAGFDSHIHANVLFPGPGKYQLKCVYSPPLSRNYFQGNTIWGKEDGPLESARVPISVE